MNLRILWLSWCLGTGAAPLDAIGRLTRFRKNVLPTAVLSVLGGVSATPHDWAFLSSPAFLTSVVVTQAVTAGSMVINDLYDVEVDRINHPDRPLVTGEVTVPEARALTIALFASASAMGHVVYHDSAVLPVIVDGCIAMSILYTPVWKRLFLVKNLVCASIVASTIYFSGVSVSPLGGYAPLLDLTTSFVFGASWFLELLLDLSDTEGDRAHGIPTLPVVLGRDVALTTAGGILITNVVMSAMALSCAPLVVVLVPILVQMVRVRASGYTSESLRQITQQTLWLLIVFFWAIVGGNHR
jgi:geranylgeranylglycerol-phosphate geranylgeranyltransferase